MANTPTNDGCEMCKYVRTETIGSRTLHLFVHSDKLKDEDGQMYEYTSCIVRYGEEGWEYQSTLALKGVEEAFELLLANFR